MRKRLLTISLVVVYHTAIIGDGEMLYKNCTGCHGDNGRTIALHVSKAIAGQSSDKTVKQLTAYKKGQLNLYGLGSIMQTQAITLSKSDIQALAKYIEGLQ